MRQTLPGCWAKEAIGANAPIAMMRLRRVICKSCRDGREYSRRGAMHGHSRLPRPKPIGDNAASTVGRVLIVNRSLALKLLTQHKSELARRFGVTTLALFGSTARDHAGDTSDVDILVSFDGPATSERYFGTQFYLEDLFGCAIDLVTQKALRVELRPHVERDLVHV